MFRDMTRKKQELSKEECIEILKKGKRGVLSVIGDKDYPYGMPMNHFYNEGDGKIYFHCGKVGHRLDAIKRNEKCSFCTYDEGYRSPDHWALNIKSVIVFGRIKIIDNMQTIVDISRRLSLKFTNDVDYIKTEIEKYSKNTLLLELTPEHISGKLVNES